MRLIRIRRGFQADHSSSSYLFYAVDHPVSGAGQAIAHRYSSRADVDDRHVRYLKWGESSLNPDAFKTLLDEHYDVMAEESYDWWTLIMMVPKTREMKEALADFSDARDYDGQGVEVEEYRKRMAVTVHCQFEGNGVEFATHIHEPHDKLVKLLAKVRTELMEGDMSFPAAVAEFYGALGDDEDESGDELADLSTSGLDRMRKAELQEECRRRGIELKTSWNKAQLKAALAEKSLTRPRGQSGKPPRKLSRAAKTILDQMERT
jgi:hypothetical protein